LVSLIRLRDRPLQLRDQSGIIRMRPAVAIAIRNHPTNYRVGDEWSRAIFWPLEQLDRKWRADAWNRF
jgi:hypothetical protein